MSSKKWRFNSTIKIGTFVLLRSFGSYPIMGDVEATHMNTLDVANTIVEQLGGRKFIAMTGARNFVGSDKGVSFKLPGGGGFCKSGINFVEIELEPGDTYTVTFLKMRKQNGVPAAMFTSIKRDVYFAMLQELFTRETGLAVRL